MHSGSQTDIGGRFHCRNASVGTVCLRNSVHNSWWVTLREVPTLSKSARTGGRGIDATGIRSPDFSRSWLKVIDAVLYQLP